MNKTLRTVDAAELAALLVGMKPGERLDFFESYDEESGETSGAYGAVMIREFDSDIIFINYYGGGVPLVIDVSVYDSDLKRITAYISEYFSDMEYNLTHVYVGEVTSKDVPVVVKVYGGLVQAIYAPDDENSYKVYLADYDNLETGHSPEDEAYVQEAEQIIADNKLTKIF